MIPQTTELSQIQAAFIDKDNRIEELMRQINSAQSLLNSLKDTMNSLVGDGKITIQTYAGSNVGDFTVNQKEDKTITLPQQATVNNGILIIQNNGTPVGIFTANQSEDTTANITVPTKTSEITNDSDFVSDANYVHTDNNFTNADKAEIGKINNSLQFTYVIDDDQKLNNWANNVAGNDYTRVLVKEGTYNINNDTQDKKDIIDLYQTGTLLVMFEKGAKIIASDNVRVANQFNYVFVFEPDTFPTNINEYPVIYNANVEFSSKGMGVSFSRNCINHNCQCVLTSNYTTNFFGACAYDGVHAEAIHCTAESSSNYVRRYLTRNAKKVIECYSSTMTIYASYRVRDCICAGYSNSYSSPTANSTYACANTLNGGWNTTV